MKRELQLKELAPYLPYGLKVVCASNEIYSSTNIWEVEGLVRGNVYLKELTYPADLFACKPILRPLTEFMSLQDGTMFFSPYTLSTLDMDGGLEANINSIPYSDFIWLVSELFDVFGLIEAGLAPDKNTLPNQS